MKGVALRGKLAAVAKAQAAEMAALGDQLMRLRAKSYAFAPTGGEH
jgi:hypothetical protein